MTQSLPVNAWPFLKLITHHSLLFRFSRDAWSNVRLQLALLNVRFMMHASACTLSEAPRIRAGEEADAGDIAPTKTRIGRRVWAKTNREKCHRLKTSKPNFGKFRIISKSPDGPLIATIRTDRPANFLSRNGRRALAGCREKSK
jgi:hypothetical protein